MSRKAGRPESARRTARAGVSWASSPSVRRRMQQQKTRDTGPELAVRRLLHRAGLRYRIDVAPLRSLRRRADIVFGPSRVAVFIDGCFWHGCPEHGVRRASANSDYWAEKIARNRARDQDTDNHLQAEGWLPIRFWEHEPPDAVASLITDYVRQRRPRSPS
ncbi:very short patch repair endonuclease [Nocardia sp. NPDC050697]|uniref:very short patch repair endonuclease n=1 Tax=Nocardia sp. NPDC050697 TaxID=3155158 RepID=UPI00340BDDA9